MTTRFRRIILGLGAALIALGMGAALYASTQNTSDADAPFVGRRGSLGRVNGGPLWPMRFMAWRLSLSDSQRDQIKSIMQSHRAEWKALADRAIEARKGLSQAMTADPIDEGSIRSKSVELAAVHADIAVARAHARDEMFKVLTPDQQVQAKAIRGKVEDRIGRRLDRLKERFDSR